MPQPPSKRNPLSSAPSSQDIMTGARRRQSQPTGLPESHNTSKPVDKNANILVSHNTRKQESQQAVKPEGKNASMQARQNAVKPVNQQASVMVKRKATFYLPTDLQKALKKVAYLEETNQSQVVEEALTEYISKRPSSVSR